MVFPPFPWVPLGATESVGRFLTHSAQQLSQSPLARTVLSWSMLLALVSNHQAAAIFKRFRSTCLWPPRPGPTKHKRASRQNSSLFLRPFTPGPAGSSLSAAWSLHLGNQDLGRLLGNRVLHRFNGFGMSRSADARADGRKVHPVMLCLKVSGTSAKLCAWLTWIMGVPCCIDHIPLVEAKLRAGG